MGLIGENGAGKSTTINAILDLIHKDDGTVTFWGQELSSTKQIKEDVGVVFDGINFYETLTPAKVGKIAGAAYKQWDGHLFRSSVRQADKRRSAYGRRRIKKPPSGKGGCPRAA